MTKIFDHKVTFNISGLRFETYESTLLRFPDTLLGSASSREQFYDPHRKEYFINRNRSIFDSILYYYQSNGRLIKPDNIPEPQFLREITYFKIGEPGERKSYLENVDHIMLGEEKAPTEGWLRRTIWHLFNWPSELNGAKVICVINVISLIASISVSCMESVADLQKQPNTMKAFRIIDHICHIWFIIDYFMRILVSTNRRCFIKAPLNIIDLLSLIPYILQFVVRTRSGTFSALRAIRLLRIIRVMKFTRYSTGMRALIFTLYASRKELLLFGVILSIILVLSASLVYFAEGMDPNSLLKSVPEAMWWSVNTITTVGYGDSYPKTNLGKFFGGFVTLLGAVVIGLPIYCFVSNFLKLWESIKMDAEENEPEANVEQCRRIQQLRLNRMVRSGPQSTPEIGIRNPLLRQ